MIIDHFRSNHALFDIDDAFPSFLLEPDSHFPFFLWFLDFRFLYLLFSTVRLCLFFSPVLLVLLIRR
jgi:hypothetical protein